MAKVRFEQPDTPSQRPKTRIKTNLQGRAFMAEIPARIGEGENAKNSFIWISIRWSFIIGGLITLGLYFRPTYCSQEYFGNMMEDIKAAWAIFMPVITLAFGYAFGKSNNG